MNEMTNARNRIEELQGLIKTRVAEASHAKLTECALLDDAAQASDVRDDAQLEK